MTNLTFTYRSSPRPWFRRGSVTLLDGFHTDEFGRTTTYALVRPLAFREPEDPHRTSLVDVGFSGLQRFNIRSGRVTVAAPSSKHVLLSPGTNSFQFIDGSVDIKSQRQFGALADFSVWGSNKEDPWRFYVESATDTDSGGVTQPFTRVSAIFVPHRRTRYLAVGARVQNMPNTGAYRTHYLKKWMLEPLGVSEGEPSPYSQAREVVVKIRPDRLNWSTNPGLAVDTTNWYSTTREANEKSASGWGGRRDVAAGAWDVFNHVIPEVRPGEVYTASLMVESTTPAKITLLLSGAEANEIRDTTVTTVGSRIQVQFTAPNSGPVTLNYRIDSTGPATTVRFWDMIVERTENWDHTYFDGSSTVDHLWEKDGTPGNARSYLYKNRAERYAAIKRVLEENVPMGIGIADPVFATLPAD